MFYKIYVLKLEDNKWYIGYTKDVGVRFQEHLSGSRGSAWTRKHMPLLVADVIETPCTTDKGAAQYENMVTLQYALKYGEDNVRGGRYTSIKYPNYPK